MSTIPSIVIWAYLAFALVIAIGLVAVFRRGDWQGARGLDKLIVLGPMFYAAPIAAFGTEHFTVGKGIASLIPKWILTNCRGQIFDSRSNRMTKLRQATSVQTFGTFWAVRLTHEPKT